MEAPEKLYLSKNIYGTYLYQVPDPDDDTTVEYTRTDVFVEKAQRWIEENICEYCEGENIIFTANNTQYIDILNQQQFIEDFKKYMEE